MSTHVHAPHDGMACAANGSGYHYSSAHNGYVQNTPPAGAPKPNRFGGKCIQCGQYVKALTGVLSGKPGHWTVTHRPGECVSNAIEATPGVYRRNGEVYVVRPSKSNPDRIYALRLVESAPRVTLAGTEIPFELQHAPGMIYKLQASERLELADANEVSARYGCCFNCHHGLKAAKTIKKCQETGMWLGDTCRATLGYE